MITLREQKNTGQIEREALRSIPLIRPPNAGRVWRGIPHSDLAEAIVNELETRDVTITDETWHVAGKTQDVLSGSLSLRIPNREAPEGTTFSLGVHHGNMRNFALKIAVGAKIFICSNGMVSGDVTLRHLHTCNFNLRESISEGIEAYLEKTDSVTSIINSMKELPLSDLAAEHILMETGRKGLLPWSRVGKVDKEYRESPFPEFREHHGNGWGMYNAFTHVLQKSPAHEQIRAMDDFRHLLAAA